MQRGLDRAPMSEEDLLELVRVRLRRGFEPAKLPLLLEAELAIEPAVTERAVAVALAERERAARRTVRRRLGAVAAGVLALGLLRVLGDGSRGIGMLLVLAGVGGGLFLVSWVLSELLTGDEG